MGAVEILLLSEELDLVRVTAECTACDYVKEETLREESTVDYEQKLSGEPCPNCDAPALFVAKVQDLIEHLVELADQMGADIEVISVETEEGQMLLKSFGGIAAILRFNVQG